MAEKLNHEPHTLFPDVVHPKTPGQILLGLTIVCEEVSFKESVIGPVTNKIISGGEILEPDDLISFLDRRLRTFSRRWHRNVPYEDKHAKYASPILSAIVSDFDEHQRLLALWNSRLEDIAISRIAAEARNVEERRLRRAEALQMKFDLYVERPHRGRVVVEETTVDNQYLVPTKQIGKISGNKRQQKKKLRKITASIGSAGMSKRVRLPSQLELSAANATRSRNGNEEEPAEQSNLIDWLMKGKASGSKRKAKKTDSSKGSSATGDTQSSKIMASRQGPLNRRLRYYPQTR
jgi:hypothetical protein